MVCIFIFDDVTVKKKENSITAQKWNKAFTRILQGPEGWPRGLNVLKNIYRLPNDAFVSVGFSPRS